MNPFTGPRDLILISLFKVLVYYLKSHQKHIYVKFILSQCRLLFFYHRHDTHTLKYKLKIMRCDEFN